MNNVERAVSVFKEGFSCSQAILSTYGTQFFGLDREIALKISGAFGSGMSRMGETCGAVTGAFMVIGLKYGQTRVEDVESKEKAYRMVKEFVNKFKSRNGSIVCRELLGCDVSTPEGMKLAKEKKLFRTICPNFVKDAAEIIEQIL
ncbi:MAG: C-GCAxxG-C-C family protein [Candidatus Freyarchaeum deiterrae]